MENKIIKIELEDHFLTQPITEELAFKSIEILNIVFNLPQFEDELSKQSFFCSNRPDLCSNNEEILGRAVYNDFISKTLIKINLTVKQLRNPWKRFVSGTLGETNPNGNSIISYTWWLKEKNGNDLLIAYATHIGHEIFHTKYLKYIHEPEFGSSKFINEKDVTYMIDDILEKLIRKTLNP